MNLDSYLYAWPPKEWTRSGRWQPVAGRRAHAMEMPESAEELARDSRWPAFFPCPISLVTTTDGTRTALEKVVGASIVNRFPYVIALSFCRRHLSGRHHVRSQFMEILERGGSVAVQYLPPGLALEAVMGTIAAMPDACTQGRIQVTGLRSRPGITNPAPVFADAYMVYEARLVKPGKDFEGNAIFREPWADVGSHRVYFLEISAIQLREDIAAGRSQIHWRGLPAWKATGDAGEPEPESDDAIFGGRYRKGYTPHYAFPSPGTIAFEADGAADGMAIKHLAALPEDQVEVDNDRARWPCFFPSSAGLITTWTDDFVPNVMPCGSTTVVSRQPMVITPCVSYAAINQRYAPRASLDLIRKRGRFGCGVPHIDDRVVNAIRYTGNISVTVDRDKVTHAGLGVWQDEWAPVLRSTPVHYDCEVTGEIRLGTHIMFLGEVRRIHLRDDVTAGNPLEWYPWADVRSVEKSSVTQSGA